MKKQRLYNRIFILPILLLVSIYSCKAQNISDSERLTYTLENYEHCLFYSDQLSKDEGINLRKLNCGGYHIYKRDYTKKSKELLLEVIKKKYSNEYIKEISKKRVLKNYKSRLEEISEKLKDSANFMYGKRFNRRQYTGYKKQKVELEKLLSSGQPDTIPKYKKEIDNLSNYLQNYKISNSLIYAVAFVEEKDKAITFLKELLKDTTHISGSAIKLSLAKLKVEPYYTNQLTKLKENVDYILSNKDGDNRENSLINIKSAYPRAGLLLTKEAILVYSKVLEAKYFDTIDHGDVSESSIPIRTLDYLLDLINNSDFQDYFKEEDGFHKSYLECTKADVEWVIEWFKSNKDKIEINKEHIPSLYSHL